MAIDVAFQPYYKAQNPKAVKGFEVLDRLWNELQPEFSFNNIY